MKKALGVLVYTAALTLAIPAGADVSDLSEMRDGDMKKLNIHSDPKPAGTSAFETFEGETLSLADYEGKWTLVNFWATWCAPCREEMPALSELQSELGGDDFEVVTIATGRNPPPAMETFFEEIGVDNLPLNRDPRSTLAREMAVLGLPITVILNPEGQEVARLTGDADWASDDAKTLIEAMIAD
ncbi:Thiol-disulfide isomerase or thioredoxin [Roseivivax halotolerans]|uniref:Thiol-disulfide isomerase or thioredoxin n=1 Tax=Roseivivax halotolerans TaxID=93684 RepID=A0A1I5V6D0_9RHOB|nr:TlpA disulfide reductase family protein [Roseivivax halotolerans]SFQ03084.1 Thiol-disulfide isomerase or thioredoxin [Roseivivax halotolerans]